MHAAKSLERRPSLAGCVDLQVDPLMRSVGGKTSEDRQKHRGMSK